MTRTMRPSAARQRLLDAATRVFYAEGIHAVGVDRIIAEAGVTRVTFYRHFPSKEDLIQAYLSAHDAEIRANVGARIAAARDPRAAVSAMMGSLGTAICAPGFRGCAFINAAAEYPDPAQPIAKLVAGHRRWFRDTATDLLTSAGHPDPAGTAALLLMVRDGAMVGGYLDDAETVRANLSRAVEALLPSDN
ncbi:TetR family transcriptional regulator [Dactylosporangium sp. NPDC049742]|uniref:TetR/AcrR family transcriptional regulator n=1 Tax=Dactylosporangium sp. NPDC049742 TaxID=3154737 RepID=UPI00343FA678